MGNAITIGGAGFLDDSITSDVIADGTLTAAKLASNAISAAKIATNALTAAKFASAAFDAGIATPDLMARFVKGELVERATEGLAGATAALFDVSGRVLLTSIVGEVTTIIETQACDTKLQANPTAAGSSVDLCAVLDITGDVVGTLYGITGTLADAMLSGLAIPAQTTPIVLQAGTIDLVTADNNTGSIAWSCHYIPLEDGAEITVTA